MSQAELADEVSIEKEEIDAIEKGKKDPSVTKLYRIAHLFRKYKQQIDAYMG